MARQAMARRSFLALAGLGLVGGVSVPCRGELPPLPEIETAIRISQKHGVRLTLDECQRIIGIDASGKPADDELLRLASWQQKLVRLSLTSPPGPQLSDVGLMNLKGMPYLESLTLIGTCLTDRGLEPLAGLHELDCLTLHGPFTDAGLVAISRLSPLECLDLFGTRVRTLEFIVRLTRLRMLNLDSTYTDDSGLQRLASLPRLEQLSLRHTAIGNAGLSFLPSTLRRLYLDGTAIGRGGLAALGGLNRLTNLSLECTETNDRDVSFLAGLPLQSLNLRKTPITALALPILATMTTLQTLELGGVRIRPRDLTLLFPLDLKNLDVGDCGLQDAYRNARSLVVGYRGRLIVEFDDCLRPQVVKFVGKFSLRELEAISRLICDPEVIDASGLLIDENGYIRGPNEDDYAALRDLLKGARALRRLILPDTFTSETVRRFRHRFPHVRIEVRPAPSLTPDPRLTPPEPSPPSRPAPDRSIRSYTTDAAGPAI